MPLSSLSSMVQCEKGGPLKCPSCRDAEARNAGKQHHLSDMKAWMLPGVGGSSATDVVGHVLQISGFSPGAVVAPTMAAACRSLRTPSENSPAGTPAELQGSLSGPSPTLQGGANGFCRCKQGSHTASGPHAIQARCLYENITANDDGVSAGSVRKFTSCRPRRRAFQQVRQ